MFPDRTFVNTAFVTFAPLKYVPLKSTPVRSSPERSTLGPTMYAPRMVYLAGMLATVAALYRMVPPLLAAVSTLFVNAAFTIFAFVKYAFAKFWPDKSAPLKSTPVPTMYPFRCIYVGLSSGVVPLTPPLRMFVSPEFDIFALVMVVLRKSTPLKSLLDRSTPGPIM